ncbi:glycosyltransferase family 2 protein [Apibacter muscae]|uniref:glycosyltransferase family 2 protein n=1 Tax=Apibacter muscae TaxID=2509004 RepID=UPI0011ACAD66|nr:glycosyltransferase family 2 protein [Apibacter muscae]TWP22696.1 glycosyltransferase family 2 protein [Apibacter muscae]
MNPAISVVMAAYNAETYISTSIQSILNQSFQNFEFIIINDGSTDKTKSILEEFAKKDPRIQVIHNNCNQFVIKSRNIGLKIAKGKYIAILDSDDNALPCRLETQWNYLEENPEVFLLGSSAKIIDENGIHVGNYNAVTNYPDIQKDILNHNLFYHSSIMFRNEHLQYREKMLYCEDYDFILMLLSNQKVVINLPQSLIEYRSTTNSLSKSKNYLVHWMFLNLAKQFYLERLNYKGQDSYDSLQPETFTNLLDIDYPISKKYLEMALKIAFYEANIDHLQILLNKYRKNKFPVTNKYLFYKVLSCNHFLFTIIHQIYNKL